MSNDAFMVIIWRNTACSMLRLTLCNDVMQIQAKEKSSSFQVNTSVQYSDLYSGEYEGFSLKG
jgi:hypothetical protein